ncbi:GNAT family N-acetyltransferase [Virgibacillus sp. C22-A2]|uniref:GNAT family N-acetyltransferase n=1 Tax=Virgibacillus tibetensis TaxID=3042313 RepID=A0ABU6KCZ0_9BACI|nr:GNAT family N-acetyltransferase [Virgibacillus sp. C22-A2]
MSDTIITTGKLQVSGQPFDIRFLKVSDIPEILDLQQLVDKKMEVPAFLQPLSEKEYQNILSGNGFMIGVFVNEKMIAFRAMLIPEIDEDEHLGIDAGLSRNERGKMIYSEISNVHPDFRGNRLQTYMGELVMEHVDKERFHYAATTVAPLNIPSIKDKLVLGMEIIELKEKYNGKLRYILFRDFTEDRKPPNVAEQQTISMDNIEEQVKLLNQGYKGVALQEKDGKWHVKYVGGA